MLAEPPACAAAGCVSYRHICWGRVRGKLVKQMKGRHADELDGNAHRQLSPLPSPEPREDKPHLPPPDWGYQALLPPSQPRGTRGMCPNGGRPSQPPRPLWDEHQSHPLPPGLRREQWKPLLTLVSFAEQLQSSFPPPGNDLLAGRPAAFTPNPFGSPSQRRKRQPGKAAKPSLREKSSHSLSAMRCTAGSVRRPSPSPGEGQESWSSLRPILQMARSRQRDRAEQQMVAEPGAESKNLCSKTPTLTILAKKSPPLTAPPSHPPSLRPPRCWRTASQGKKGGELGEGRGGGTAGQHSPIH